MNDQAAGINILFPVLNERLRLESGIRRTLAYVRSNVTIPCSLTILDNGSDDETPQIGKRLQEENEEVTYIRMEERGVGVAFRKGIALNDKALVGYMDIDLSTDIGYLGKMIEAFQADPALQYVNGSRFSKESSVKGRRWYRKIISGGLVFLLKWLFHMKADDAVCGFTFLRREAAEQLVKECSDDNGWFYTIEFLLRAERKGMKIYDMPVEWQEDYNTTVKIWKTVRNYMIRMVRLKKTFRREDRENAEKNRSDQRLSETQGRVSSGDRGGL